MVAKFVGYYCVTTRGTARSACPNYTRYRTRECPLSAHQRHSLEARLRPFDLMMANAVIKLVCATAIP